MGDSQPQKRKDNVPTSSRQTQAVDPSNLSAAAEKQQVFGQDSSGPGYNGGQSSSSSSGMAGRSYAPPPGPPPDYRQTYYPPPAAPPPSLAVSPEVPGLYQPPVHNWQAIPDTADLPPPPAHAYLYSNTGNALEADADRAHDFCDNTPLTRPTKPLPAVYQAAQKAYFQPVRPREYVGALSSSGSGEWKGHTVSGNGDCIVWTDKPVYFAEEDSPLVTERQKTIYFEVQLVSLSGGTPDQTPGFSIGYVAQPYPTWRSPGWERGSLGVFSDDGCRFINDSFGGKEFTTEFLVGETVGLGMTFHRVDEKPFKTAPRPPNADGTTSSFAVEAFLTRNGQVAGKWDLHEETDGEQGSLEGLEGDFDLHGAIGFFGGVEFKACFDPAGWKWSPPAA
ncbi:hypothetical protein LOZ12_002393 [Ophidiomyces ophidiicola]|uniref:Uncharacterized protein n=1 Tax=Ophidiomyces ophidiicola TaxID=1387563 RepID=A0ACB8UXI8_9EURO|nr:hypothetical protein LOZ62_006508 [Ophidiomyces ophidiicola]KAI1972338.1 hypothetical protein LOZ56_002556 [Ophidiomyces ophidiicola]KAI1999729.1 hypothetical protein LOZ50_006545 [Ophidiomyces ophidiicola]KAI2028647.1 hypothetical protein LOZ48_004112 [Ophidiomyces ophidiicola]KAI2030614.1 hypothetical protein LOZ47_006434 [Ophidiomyces ophidiicola]